MRKFTFYSWCLLAVPVLLAVTAGPLAWDAEEKEYEAKKGETDAALSFSVTNVSQKAVTIKDVKPSCGCTVVQMPQQPWKLAPGASGKINVTVNLRGKSGTLIKSLTVDSSAGKKDLTIKVTLPEPVEPGMALVDRAQRLRNRAEAEANRQAVFQGNCASCHAAPAAGKTGQELFATACAICHETPHRASMVPELAGVPHGREREYWAQWIRHGKEHSLMPAFAESEGGPLSEEQVASLVEYLTTRPESEPVSAGTK